MSSPAMPFVQPPPAPSASASAESQPQFLSTAQRIGLTLVRDAVWHDGRCNWVGNWMDYVEGVLTLVTRTFGADLYGGTSGIALFLASLHAVEPDRLLRQTIEGAIKQALTGRDQIARHGFFSGAPGVAYALMRSGEALGRDDWVEAGVDLLGATPAAQDHEIDLIGGAAGTIPVLLRAHASHLRPVLLERAVQLGEFLCAQAHRSDAGWSWSSVPATKDTTGYSHGAAGPATALLELAAITDDDGFRNAAARGYAYEQAQFDPAHGNWPDFRTGIGADPATPPGCGMSWCHGAPGIALSRLRAFELTGIASYREQAAIGLRTTCHDLSGHVRSGGWSSNYSLCHGLAGNADILLESDVPEYHQVADAVGRLGRQNYDRPRLPWPSGLPGRESNPGLMMGLAGTGYFYLRLYDSRRFETVLLPRGLAHRA